jgi:hypothetical protein
MVLWFKERHMKKLIFILFILSFSAYGKCVKEGWMGGEFCFEELGSDYATFAEIEFGDEGPRVPGWDTGLLLQIEEARQAFADDRAFAKELLVDVYMQLDYIRGLENRGSGALNKSLKELSKAILAFPRERKMDKHLDRATRELNKYSRSRE